MMPITFRASLAALFAVFSTLTCQAQTVGAGSTTVRELMPAWIAQFGATAGGVKYDPIGSSAGMAQAREGSVDFGVSDVALNAAALQAGNLRQIPLAAVAVAVIFNVPELVGRPVNLTGEILASIYNGEITQWNHSLIASNNPGLPLPNRAIVPIWRNDGSGQSYVWSKYIARTDAKWRRAVGSTYTVSFPTGRGVRGGNAMLETVRNTPGAIGYDNSGVAQRANLNMALLRNAADRFVAPNPSSISAAISLARWDRVTLAADLDGTEGVGSYPMSSISYALISGNRKGGVNPLPFLRAAVASGDAQVTQFGLVPLPDIGKSLLTQLK